MRILHFLYISLALTASPPKLMGTAYAPDNKQNASPIFSFRAREEQVGDKTTFLSEFLSPEGRLLVSEEALLEKNELRHYEIHQLQLDQEWKLDISSKNLVFHYSKPGGKTAQASEDCPDNLVVGPTLIRYIQDRWDLLTSGKTKKIRFAALDRHETVGFRIEKESEGSEQGRSTITFVMSPSSFFVQLVVKPIHLTFWKKEREILSIRGRTLPKRWAGNHWEDQDPLIIYRHAG